MIKKFLPFWEPEDLLARSEVHAIGSYFDPVDSSPHCDKYLSVILVHS
jgi:hypothetical protein